MDDHIDLLTRANRENPYPTYARLRRERPVCQVDPGRIWAISRYADVQYAFKHSELFSSGAFQAAFKPEWLPHNPLGDSIIAMDPPIHAKLRALVSRAFTSRGIARLEPFVRAAAAGLAEKLRDVGEAEFLAEFGVPFPAQIIAETLGVDPSLHRSFKRWSIAMATITAPPTEASKAELRHTVTEMERYMTEVIRERRRAPTDDTVSDLIRAQVNGQALTDADIIAFLFLLLPAGLETTTNLLANVMLGFLERPGDMTALRERPDTIPAYVEEVLRYDPPVQAMLRVATQDVELSGTTIPAGATVIVLIGAANRDEARFADPDRFDPSRPGNAGDMAFGHGIHFCLGAPLARMEVRIAIEELVARFRGVELLSDSLDWFDSLTVRGPTALPLRFLPA